MPEIQELTASALRSAYLSNELSPVEVTAALLDRIDRLNPGLRAFVALCPEEAMSAARYAEAVIRRTDPNRTPPLFGVPITIKDLVDVAGMPTTMGSLVTTREPAAKDEAFVESLRGAGAIILGKTNTSEFGLAAQTSNRLGEPCANPWDSERTAGGSSGGAAAACAAGLGPLHHGTDGGGSVRVPAAYCGVFGFKPTGRRIPRRSRGAGMSQISSDGVLARSVADIAMMMTAMTDDAYSDPIAYRDGYHTWLHTIEQEDIEGLRVAWTTQLGWPTPCEPEIVQRVERAAELLSDSGADVEEASPPVADPNEVFPTLSAIGAAANYGPMCIGREEDLSDYTQGSLRRGRALTGVQVAQAYANLDELQRRMQAWFQQYDILLTPTSAISALGHGESIDFIAGKHVSPWTTSILYTPLANLIQAPAIAVPAGLDSDGLPISVQLVAKEGNDDAVLRCAAMLDAVGLNDASRLAPV